MPICPRCNSTIHREAKEQCPACGYSLRQQEEIFGRQPVVFPRVLDYAGVLLQQERNALLDFLADLERSIPPVALCIYLTNHGQSQEFRSHAHWILNHAHIHTPSFGKREGRRAIEDAELRELRPGDTPRHERQEEAEESVWARGYHWLRHKLFGNWLPYPPPARQEWMLILVVDVQLKMACFSWGYMLDPYINPDKINSCITAARLQFRERATMPALQLVMKKAVKQIETSARRVNRTLGKGGRSVSPVLAALLGLSLFSAPTAWATPQKTAKAPAKTAKVTAKPAAKAKPKTSAKPKTTAKPAAKPKTTTKPAVKPAPKQPAAPLPDMPDDAVAEEVEPTPADTPPAATPPPEPPPAADNTGAAASIAAAPRWNADDYKLLMEGKLGVAYNLLLPQGKPAAPQGKTPPRPAGDESDTTVSGRYCPEYKVPSRAGLSDPQGLLTDVERNDVEHVMRDLNAKSGFRIYAAVFKAGQSIPQELSAGTLATAIAMPCEYAAVILYSIGDEPGVQLGYQEIALSDEQQRNYLLQIRNAATQAGGGASGLIAAIRALHAGISPMATGFRPIKPEAQVNVPRIPIELKNIQKEKEKSYRDRIREWAKTPEATTIFIETGIALVVLALVVLCVVLRRRVVRLIDTTPDIRLSSPYGAGVSRYVRYLDGKEAAKQKTSV